MQTNTRKVPYIKTPEDLGINVDTTGIYIMTENSWIAAMHAPTGKLMFGVGEAPDGTIRNRMDSLSSSKDLKSDKYIIDTIPTPGYADHSLHKVIATKFAVQHRLPNGRGAEVFNVKVPSDLLTEFRATNNFEPIREWLVENIRTLAATLNPAHIKRSVALYNTQKFVIDTALEIIKRRIDAGNSLDVRIVCDLAARSGKTISFLSMFRRLHEEYETAAMFIMAYGVGLSVRTSYEKEMKKYADYRKMQFIDASDDDAEIQYNTANNNGKLPVVFISLNPDVVNSKKHKWINALRGTYVGLLEETDFGNHTDDQVKKVEYLLAKKTVIRYNASGTNVGKLAKAFGGERIDDIISVPYSMVEQDPSIPNVVTRRFHNMLFDSKINKYLEGFDVTNLPTMKKILSKPYSQQRFLTVLFQDLYGYTTHYGFNLSQRAGLDIVHTMLFVNITKKVMNELANVIERACSEHKVLVLHGDHTTNKEAEDHTNEELVKLKNEHYPGKTKLIVITNMMGTRSYSIPEIQACLFMQDGGSVHPYTQKYSRCLTPGLGKEFGDIFDFSFDQSKTRNTVMSIGIDANKVSKAKKLSFPAAVRDVLNSVLMTDISGKWVSSDDIILMFEDNNKLLEVANASTNIDIADLTPEEIEIFQKLALGAKLTEKSKSDKTVDTGKNYEVGTKKEKSDTDSSDHDSKLITMMKKAIQRVNGSATTVIAMTNYTGNGFVDCLNIISKNTEMQEEFIELYQVTPKEIIQISDRLEIPTLDVIIENSIHSTTQKHVTDSGLALLKDPEALWTGIFKKRALYRKLCTIVRNKDAKILNIAGGYGTEIDILVDMFGIDITKKIVFVDKYSHLCNQIKRKYPMITVMKGDFRQMEFNNMKFDVVVCNPPYKGQAQLHQQFFNKAVELLKDNGRLAFIQPATIYYNKKEETQKHSQTVRDNIKKYKTSVEFIHPKIFENANVFNDLAITHLVKTPSADEIESVTYTSGTQYTNVRLEDVTKTEMEPNMYASIVKKYKAFVAQHGSLLDVTTHDATVKKARITAQRGNVGCDDVYTFMPAPKKYWINHGDFGVPAKSDVMVENIYNYFTSNFARFGLAIYKFAGDLHGGAMGCVPLVPFNKKYTDDELYDMIGLNTNQREAIANCLPDYYDRYRQSN